VRDVCERETTIGESGQNMGFCSCRTLRGRFGRARATALCPGGACEKPTPEDGSWSLLFDSLGGRANTMANGRAWWRREVSWWRDSSNFSFVEGPLLAHWAGHADIMHRLWRYSTHAQYGTSTRYRAVLYVRVPRYYYSTVVHSDSECRGRKFRRNVGVLV
jgi:hypothetical protein